MITDTSSAFFDLSYEDTALGLYGAPVVVGDTIKWFPSGSPGFTAYSEGDGARSVNSVFSMTLNAKPGYQIAGFSLVEGGEYVYFGDGAGVGVAGSMSVSSPGNAAVGAPITASSSFSANPEFDFTTQGWLAASTLNLGGGATSQAGISISNSLLASTPIDASLSFAFIEKLEVDLRVLLTEAPSLSRAPVSEPVLPALLGIGLLGLLLARRRAEQA